MGVHRDACRYAASQSAVRDENSDAWEQELGLFGKKRKNADADDDQAELKDLDSAVHAIAADAEVVSIFESIESMKADFDPFVQPLINRVGDVFCFDADSNVRMLVVLLVLCGYVFRVREVDNGAAAPGEIEADVLLSLDDEDVSTDLSGYNQTVNRCVLSGWVPFEDGDVVGVDLPNLVPGSSHKMRTAVRLLMIARIRQMADAREVSDLMPNGNRLRRAFGAGFLIHVWSELAPDGWLDGLEVGD